MDREGLREDLAKANNYVLNVTEMQQRKDKEHLLLEERRAPAYELMDAYKVLLETTKDRVTALITVSPAQTQIETLNSRSIYRQRRGVQHSFEFIESALIPLGEIDKDDLNYRTHLFARLDHNFVVKQTKNFFKYYESSPRYSKNLSVTFYAGPIGSEINQEQLLEIKKQTAECKDEPFLQDDFQRSNYADLIIKDEKFGSERWWLGNYLTAVQNIAEALDFIDDCWAAKNSLQPTQ